MDFLSTVEGANRTSSKGYYGGSYQIEILNGTETVFSIGFGDDETFNHGDFGDGYPARYELRGVSREDVIRFLCQYDTSGFDWGIPTTDIISYEDAKIYFKNKVYVYCGPYAVNDAEYTEIGTLSYSSENVYNGLYTDCKELNDCEVTHLSNGLTHDALVVSRKGDSSLLYIPKT